MRVRFVFFVILFLLVLSALFIFERIANAGEIEEPATTTMQSESYAPVIQIPEETSEETESVNNFYISIPGIKNITVSKAEKCYDFYNPSDNQCALKYEIYANKKLLFKTDFIKPGCSEKVSVYEIVRGNSCLTEIIVKAQSVDGCTDYNSAKQNTQIVIQD